MTSRSRTAAVGLAAFLAAGACIAGASAQQSSQQSGQQPVPTSPQQDPQTPGATGKPRGIVTFGAPSAPPYGEGGGASILAPTPGFESITTSPGLAGSGVAVGGLEPVESGALGLLGPETGGFAPDLWEGTKRGTLDRLLARLPTRTGSPTLTDLSRRVLLSRGAPPEATGAGPAALSDESFLALRFDRLYALGATDFLRQMIVQSARSETDPGVIEVETRIRLIERNLNTACTNAASLRAASTDLFWTEVQCICYLAVGDRARANLTVDILRERGAVDDAFVLLVANVADKAKFKIEKIERPSSSHIALLRLAKATFPEGSLDAAPAIILKTLAEEDPSLGETLISADGRITAAEMAVDAGATEVSTLKALYSEVDAEITDAAELAKRAAQQPGPKTNALLFRAFEAETLPERRAEWMALAITALAKEGLARTAAELYGPHVRGMGLQPGLAGVAPEIVYALIADGAYDQALGWLDLLEATAMTASRTNTKPDDPALAAAVGDLDFVRAGRFARDIGLGNPAPDTATLAKRLSAPASPRALRQAYMELAVLQGLGLQVPQDARDAALARPASTLGNLPPPEVFSGLETASFRNRAAETVLHAATAFANAPLADAHPTTVTEVIKALGRVGLAREARALAVEALTPSLL